VFRYRIKTVGKLTGSSLLKQAGYTECIGYVHPLACQTQRTLKEHQTKLNTVINNALANSGLLRYGFAPINRPV
jgi:hypothetical protein